LMRVVVVVDSDLCRHVSSTTSLPGPGPQKRTRACRAGSGEEKATHPFVALAGHFGCDGTALRCGREYLVVAKGEEKQKTRRRRDKVGGRRQKGRGWTVGDGVSRRSGRWVSNEHAAPGPSPFPPRRLHSSVAQQSLHVTLHSPRPCHCLAPVRVCRANASPIHDIIDFIVVFGKYATGHRPAQSIVATTHPQCLRQYARLDRFVPEPR
jgi:hypothetical protein